MTFILGKNEFWSLNDGTVKAMARLILAIPGMTGASYSMVENIPLGEVNGTFTLNGNTITTESWVQADNTVTNQFITNFTYSGTESKSVTVSLAVGNQNTYGSSIGSSGDVLYIDVTADNMDAVGGYATCKVRVATRVIGTAGIINNNALNFTLSPGNTYSLVTCIMSNYDSASYQSQAISSISSETRANIDSLNNVHCAWWNNFYGKSFVEIPNKTIEKEFYGSLYLLASCSRTSEAPPGLWANWVMENPAWNSDYTLNYNYEAPFYMACPTNHPELADSYDKPIIDWVPNAQSQASDSGWTGAFYRVHIGPVPNGSADHNTWNQKFPGAFAATDMIMHYYYTHDLTYANKVYGTLKPIAIFWQNYLTWDGTRYVDYKDAQQEGDSYPQTNGVMSLGLIRFLLKGVIDLSSALNQDSSSRAIWENRLMNLSAFPTFVRNGVTVFRWTEVGDDWVDGNDIGSQHIYPGSQIGLGSDSALLAIGKNMIGQMARWSDGNATPTFYPAAARIGYDPNTILTQLNLWVTNNTYPNLHIHTGGGGIENLNTVPATLCEMLVQSFQDTIRLFADWPTNTYGKFGDMLTYGGFLVSSDMENNAVQYVRIISSVSGNCTFVNPCPGQALQIYRNGIDSGTITGNKITIPTSVNETIHLAINGTPYSIILARMNTPAGQVVEVVNNSPAFHSEISCAIAKKLFDRTRDRVISFAAMNPYNDMKRITVGIYSLNGVLVKELVSNSNLVQWNMTTQRNLPVAIGGYAYEIKLERKSQAIMESGTFQIVQ